MSWIPSAFNRRPGCLWGIWLCLATVATAQSPLPRPTPPTPLQDDAQLHDVHLVGSQQGWAVGDHGVIWTTRDGGATWTLQSSGVACGLHSVWFINRTEGWIVGGETQPLSHLTRGVVLHTSDGGEHWELLWPRGPGVQSPVPDETKISPPNLKNTSDAPRNRREDQPVQPAEESAADGAVSALDPGASFKFQPANISPPIAGAGGNPSESSITRLPRLRRVRFFTTRLGLAAGVADEGSPAGVYQTTDGGRSWSAVGGEEGEEWLGADFANAETGVVVGARGEAARLVKRRLDRGRRPAVGNRGLHDVALASASIGWLAGDGALILTTRNGGLVWEAPDESLPAETRSLFDFRAVACRGESVWVAGEPGGVVWRTTDSGLSWSAHSTGQNLPITAIHFSDELRGCAVGALGLVLTTSDGGTTWKSARGAGRRVAFWQVHGQGNLCRLALPVELSGDAGYRSLVEVVAREDLGQAERLSRDFPQRLREAVPRAGGSAASVCWQFPLGVPGLERNLQRLIAEWNRRNENRFEELLLGRFVRQIRMWRPSVIMLDAPTDPLSELVTRVMLRGVEQAADPAAWPDQQELAGLEPWQVDRVCQRAVGGQRVTVQLERHRLLPRLGLSNTAATRQAEQLLFETPPAGDDRPAWNVIWPADSPSLAAPRGGFFTGLRITPGSAARRPLQLGNEDALAAAEALAKRRRNFAAVTDRALPDPMRAATLLAELPAELNGLSAEQGADVLGSLAQQYAAAGRWELAELTLIELSRRYPEEPAGQVAMQQLIEWWTSSELAWRRSRPTGQKSALLVGSPDSAQRAIQQAVARLEQQTRSAGQSLFNDDGEPTPLETTGTVTLTGGEALVVVDQAQLRDHLGQVRFWHSQAARLARELQRRSPELARQPRVQFPMAALFRAEGLFHKSDELFSQQTAENGTGLWRKAAQAEFWLANRAAPPDFHATVCAGTREPPLLDGVLSDPCWQQAEEVVLTSAGPPGEKSARTLVFLCCDEEYLYWAGTIPRDREAKGAQNRLQPRSAGRRHDGCQRDLDHVTLLLDLDRDYHTGFQLTIDLRGETGDVCLSDPDWNPRWYVAVDSDPDHWRFEAAIPWSELAPIAPSPGTPWLMGCVRTIPAVSVLSWGHPCMPLPRPESYGLLRFE